MAELNPFDLQDIVIGRVPAGDRPKRPKPARLLSPTGTGRATSPMGTGAIGTEALLYQMSERMDIIWILRSPQIVASVQGGHCEVKTRETDVFTWNMGLVIPEVFIRINMSASQPETPENTISP
ncbi:hypothetical protein Bbelb_290970 [Branchiostoma belcheri]|nr:hypothetical protein Bbelb_290970 [Branchiostoma belcheri]